MVTNVPDPDADHHFIALPDPDPAVLNCKKFTLCSDFDLQLFKNVLCSYDRSEIYIT